MLLTGWAENTVKRAHVIARPTQWKLHILNTHATAKQIRTQK
jgi:hypothetical protein